MKITNITVEWAETIRPADFESKKCGLTVSVQLEEGDDAKVIADQMLSKVKAKVRGALQGTPVTKPEPGADVSKDW